MNVEIPLTQLPHGAHLDLPYYATPGAAGMDLMAAIGEAQVLGPGKRAIIPTGLSIGLPTGYEAQVRPRSGLAAKHGVTVLNSPGTIDSDYRGEIGVILINLGDEPFTIEPGMRIAQMVVAAHAMAGWNVLSPLTATIRGGGGFGSTGTNR